MPASYTFALIDPALLCYNGEGDKTTADPSTPLRFAQDDSSVTVQLFRAGSVSGQSRTKATADPSAARQDDNGCLGDDSGCDGAAGGAQSAVSGE
jgi:hypothetical protein